MVGFNRSKELTVEQILDGVPDVIRDATFVEVMKLIEEFLIWRSPESNGDAFILNPNKRDVIKRYLSRQIPISEPLEDYIPEGFEKDPAFKTTGAKDSKGIVGTYFYYRNSLDRYHFTVLIQISINLRPDKIDLGTLRQTQSMLSIVLDGVNRLPINKFIKADLDKVINNRRIIQNRQPVKAAIDVLDFLGYVMKTGKRIGRSEEYERTDRQPVEEGLGKFFGEDFKP
jgi:hypothetical protein